MYFRLKILTKLGSSFDGPLHPTPAVARSAALTMLAVHSAPVRVELHELTNPRNLRETRVAKTMEKLF